MGGWKKCTNWHQFIGTIRDSAFSFRKYFPEFAEIPLCFEIETNSRYDGDTVCTWFSEERIFSQIRQDQKYISLGEMIFPTDPSGNIHRVGHIKTLQRTRQYIFTTSDFLNRSALKIYDTFRSINSKLSTRRVLRESKDEMKRLAWPKDDPNNPRYSGNRGGTVTGKFMGKRDDNITAIQACIYYTQVRLVENQTIKKIGRYAYLNNPEEEESQWEYNNNREQRIQFDMAAHGHQNNGMMMN